jgi:hypothetical protein
LAVSGTADRATTPATGYGDFLLILKIIKNKWSHIVKQNDVFPQGRESVLP